MVFLSVAHVRETGKQYFSNQVQNPSANKIKQEKQEAKYCCETGEYHYTNSLTSWVQNPLPARVSDHWGGRGVSVTLRTEEEEHNTLSVSSKLQEK